MPAADIERRSRQGVGWVPANALITAFDQLIDSAFGTRGDLYLVPDISTEVKVDFDDGEPAEHFLLGNIRHTDGRSWACCLRSILDRALKDLYQESGLALMAAFEHEFHIVGKSEAMGSAFSLAGFRTMKAFAETFTAAQRAAGLEPDSFLRESGHMQFEATLRHRQALSAADHAVILRELAHASAARHGRRVSFSPLTADMGSGNGVHIHMSFRDRSGAAATYDPATSSGLAKRPGQFVAGILLYLPSILAFTAPSVISYERLMPGRWSAAFNNLGFRDREAAVRICPVDESSPETVAQQFNFEFRAGDAAASPYLQLAALVLAGLQGIRDGLAVPDITEEDLSLLSDDALTGRGLVRLPQSLSAALGRLEEDATVRSWFDEQFCDFYLRHKKGEIDSLKESSLTQLCAAYEGVY